MEARPARIAVLACDEWGPALGVRIAENVASNATFDSAVRLWFADPYLAAEFEDDSAALGRVVATSQLAHAVRDVSFLALMLGWDDINAIVPIILVSRMLPAACPRPSTRPLACVLPVQQCARPNLTVLCAARPLAMAGGRPRMLCDDVSALFGGRVPVAVLFVASDADGLLPGGGLCDAVVASRDEPCATRWRDLLRGCGLRVSACTDVAWVERAPALGEAVAFAVGLCAGLGLGANTMATVFRMGARSCCLLLRALSVVTAHRCVAFRFPAGLRDIACVLEASGETDPAHLCRSALLTAIISQSAGGAVHDAGKELVFRRQASPPPPCTVECAFVESRVIAALELALTSVESAHKLPLLQRLHEIVCYGRPAAHVLPRAGNEAAWHGRRRRQLAWGGCRAVGAILGSALVALAVGEVLSVLLLVAFPTKSFGEDTPQRVRGLCLLAAVGCLHSCFRWCIFGLRANYWTSLLSLLGLLAIIHSAHTPAIQACWRNAGLAPEPGTIILTAIAALPILAYGYSARGLVPFLLTFSGARK